MRTLSQGKITAHGSSFSRVDIIYPVLPPVLDGIGDYTGRFAKVLAEYCDVRVLTGGGVFDAIPGVDVTPTFSMDKPQGVRELLKSIPADPPDWLLLQFNQFSYGRWGLNPYLPLVMRELRRQLPRTRIAWMAHEDFVPVTNWKNAIMTTWQRWQFWMLGRQADVIFFSIDPWAKRYQSWWPDTPVVHLPVGSNMPYLGISRQEARKCIGISDDTFVAGVFGTINASRMLPLIRQAADALHRREDDFLVLYVGPHGDAMREELGSLPLLDAGAQDPQGVSLHLSAMDLHLAPFIDGVSTRRGSFMAGIQHGIPTVATLGELTDDVLRQADGDAFVSAPVDAPHVFVQHALALLEDEPLRVRLAERGRALHESAFSFETVVPIFVDALAGER